MEYILVFAAVMSLIVCINYKYTPKEPSFYGYKTKRSTTNRDTWLYANRVANVLLLLNIAVFIILAFILLYVLNFNEEKVLEIAFLNFGFLSIMVLPITEYLLHVKFFKKQF